jgi:carbamoyltransferase
MSAATGHYVDVRETRFPSASTIRVIGVHEGHNSAAALVENGELRWASQEERFTGIKNQGGLPRKCLEKISTVIGSGSTRIAYGERGFSRGRWQREDLIAEYGQRSPGLNLKLKRLLRKNRYISESISWRRLQTKAEAIRSLLRSEDIEVSREDHHQCHAASAYFGWGRSNENILILTCDGAGDGICASVNIGHKGEIKRLASVDQSHSIGRLYANVTYMLGMVPLEHEYKLMGLAPYAENCAAASDIAACFDRMFTFEQSDPMVWKRTGCPPMQHCIQFLQNLLRLRRFDHVAAGLQIFVENFLVRWVRNCVRETGLSKVALSGGVFMNVKANKRIMEMPEVEELFVFPSCGDETNAIGAAWLLHSQTSDTLPAPLRNLYLGPEFTATDIEEAIAKYRFSCPVRITQPADIDADVADLVAAGHVVARFKGRAEFGARALGNRSILAPAFDSKSIRVINEMIKNRDFWMPFGPAVLSEASSKYFVKPKPMPAPYMIMTFDTHKEQRDRLVAVLHPYDFSARPQEVDENANPSFYRLIKNYESRTGDGVILNTSFNLHGEPIVGSPVDALRVFDASGLKYLALDACLLAKCR